MHRPRSNAICAKNLVTSDASVHIRKPDGNASTKKLDQVDLEGQSSTPSNTVNMTCTNKTVINLENDGAYITGNVQGILCFKD